MSPPCRLAVLASHPIQYFAPLFRALAAHPGIDLTVYYCSDLGVAQRTDPEFGVAFAWDVPLLDGYRWRFLPNLRLGRAPLDLITPTLAAELWRGRYDALLLHGYAHLADWIGLVAARSAGTAVVVRGESNLLDGRPGWKRAVKRALLGTLYANADAAAYIGSQNRAYYRAYGMAEAKLVFAPYCVDNAFFQARAAELADQRAEVRASFGLPADAPVVLFCGKLIPKKRPLLALEAFAAAQTGRSEPAALLYAGDGELRAELERQVRARPELCVRIAGFLNQTHVAQAYAAADLLLLPSGWGETWGLAVNEAMNFGLPAIVSDRVGCAGDLVRHGETGFVAPVDDVRRLAEHIRVLLDEPAVRREMGARARQRLSQWSIEQCVTGLVEAVERARRARPVRSQPRLGASLGAESPPAVQGGDPT